MILLDSGTEYYVLYVVFIFCWCIYELVTCLSKVWFVSNAEHQIFGFLSKQTLSCSRYQCRDNLSPLWKQYFNDAFIVYVKPSRGESHAAAIPPPPPPNSSHLTPVSVSQLQTRVHNSQSLSNIITASLKVVNFVNSRVKCYNNNYIFAANCHHLALDGSRVLRDGRRDNCRGNRINWPAGMFALSPVWLSLSFRYYYCHNQQWPMCDTR